MNKNNLYLLATLIAMIIVTVIMSSKKHATEATNETAASGSALPTNGLVDVEAERKAAEAAKKAPQAAPKMPDGKSPGEALPTPAPASDKLFAPAGQPPAGGNVPATAQVPPAAPNAAPTPGTPSPPNGNMAPPPTGQ